VGLFSRDAPGAAPGAELPGHGSARSRIAVAALMTAVLFLGLVALQQRFNSADGRKAFEAVASWRPQADGPPVLQRLIELNNGAPPACDANVISSLKGVVHVACTVAKDPEPFAFAVQIDTGQVRPASDSTARRLGAPASAAPAP
jgi:hypothetical protein